LPDSAKGGPSAAAKSIRILLVEDEPADAELIWRALERFGKDEYSVECVESLKDCVARLGEKEDLDLVIVDLSLPDSRGLETFEQIQEHAPGLPIVILTGLDEESVALGALKLGAQDYLVKGGFDERWLPKILRYSVERKNFERMKDELLSVAAHEIRTPAAFVREATALMLDGVLGEVNGRQKHFLSLALKNVDQMSRIVDNVLRLARMDSGNQELELEDFDLAALAHETAERFRPGIEAKSLALREELPEGPVRVKADRVQIAQVLVNLMANAVKFARKGSVTLRVRGVNGSAECAVIDTGPGVPAELRKKIFSKYKLSGALRRRRSRGIGLGLTISRRIVELHQGRIHVEAAPGGGSVFVFSLPREGPAPG